jgi:hypothetical protein
MNALTNARFSSLRGLRGSVLAASILASLASTAGCTARSPEATDESGSQALASAAAPVAGTLPAGTYRGTGNYLDPADASASGAYRSEYVIAGNTLTIHLSYGPDNAGAGEDITMNLAWTSPHELTFGVGDGQNGGRGYCLDDRCHFSAVSGDVVWFEMTMTFGPHGFTTLGSKHVGDHDVYWSETLEKL